MKLQQHQVGRILVYGKPIDMRNGFSGLAALVRSKLGENPLSGDLFVFLNRRGNLVKALLWDRTGFIIIAKRLEKGRFRLRNPGEKLEITRENLELLLDGLPAGATALKCRPDSDPALGAEAISTDSLRTAPSRAWVSKASCPGL